MALMRVTRMWKSRYFWLTTLAYVIVAHVMKGVFDPVTTLTELMCWGVGLIAWWFLMPLAETAQFEADWAIPKKPRIDINE